MNQDTQNITYIALWGKKKAGKTTVGRQLLYELRREGHRTVLLSFADKLRQAYEVFFPSYGPWLKLDPETKEKHRPFMQICGDAAKAVDNDYFANDLVERAEETYNALYHKAPIFVVIDDMRYLEELEALRGSGKLISIKLESSLQSTTDGHRSESHVGLDDNTDVSWFNELRDNEGALLLERITTLL